MPVSCLAKYLPQGRTLQHPKKKAFVTHCGANSVQDAIYAAKPMLTYPGFADQPLTPNLLISSVYSRQGIEYTLCRSKTDAADLKLEVKLGLVLSHHHCQAGDRVHALPL